MKKSKERKGMKHKGEIGIIDIMKVKKRSPKKLSKKAKIIRHRK